MHDYEITISDIEVNTEFGKSLSSSNDPNLSINLLIASEKATAIYSDGSKSKESTSVGCACICPELDKIIVNTLSKDASIFTAEITALLSAVDIALNQPNRNFFIFTDSLSALVSLKNLKQHIRTNPHLFEIKKKVTLFQQKCNNKNKIKFFWIPAHKGIQGNEMADIQAKEVSKLPPKLSRNIPYTDLKEYFKKVARENNNNAITEYQKGEEFLTHYHNTKTQPWFAHKNLSRQIVSIINRCRSNHYGLAESLARIHVVDSPCCNCGYESENLNHVLFQCTTYDAQRSILLKSLKKSKHVLPLSACVLLSNPTISVCKALEAFFKNCNIKI